MRLPTYTHTHKILKTEGEKICVAKRKSREMHFIRDDFFAFCGCDCRCCCVAVVIIICDLNIRLETCKCNTYAQRSHWETLRTESIDRYSWCQANAIRLRLHSLKIHTISCSITKITMRAMHQIFTHCASWVGKFAQFGFWSVAKTHFFSPSSTMPTIAHRRR